MMEYDFADKLDLEWHSIFQKHLKYFSYQNKSETFSFEDILREVFCPAPNSEHEVKYEDKEVFEKCLTEALALLSRRPNVPRLTQTCHLLNIAKYVAKDESCFINLNSNNVFLGLAYLSQPFTEVNTKLLFLEVLYSFVEHPSGVKWLTDTRYWTEVFASTIKYHDLDNRIPKIGYEILRILLEKTIDTAQNHCDEIVKLIAQPLLETAQRIKLVVPHNSSIFEEIKPNLTCLVEILESLLKNYSVNVLHYIINIKVGLASDAISERCNDGTVCLLLDRISIILSFFGLTEVFDGIKSIQQDPLALSGFITIIDRDVDKGLFIVVFELYYYALKYLKHISDKWPQYYFRDEHIDTEAQIVALQLEPILLDWARIDGKTFLLEENDADLVSMSHPLKIFKHLYSKTLHVGLKIRDKLPACSFDVFTKAVELISRSKDLYSKKSLCSIFDSLVYCLEAPLRYSQSKKKGEVIVEDSQQLYIFELLEATLVFIESFNFNWPDSAKVLDLLYIIIEGSSSYHWIEPIMLDSLILLQEVISRRFSPSMALLIDTAEGLKNIGPLLYKTCFTNNWKVRKAVMEVVHTITLSANDCFSSFKAILLDASLPSLISTMALNDVNCSVRATALKCLQQMFVMKDIKETFSTITIIDKVLDIIVESSDAELKTEAIKLIATIYEHEKYLANDITKKIYKCLEYESLSNDINDNVQKELVDFWRIVARRMLTDKGWEATLSKFPEVTFSKRRIISLTTEEVNKRCYNVLSELSHMGVLNVFEKFWQFSGNNTDAKKSLMECLDRFHYIFRTHKITPQSMLFYQEFLDLSAIQIDSLISPQESENLLQEIISESMIEMTPVDLELLHNKDRLSLMDTSFLNSDAPSTTAVSTSNITRHMTPSEFVDLVFRTVSESSSSGHVLNQDPSKDAEVYIIDY